MLQQGLSIANTVFKKKTTICPVTRPYNEAGSCMRSYTTQEMAIAYGSGMFIRLFTVTCHWILLCSAAQSVLGSSDFFFGGRAKNLYTKSERLTLSC
jgi:hypothetical protein